MNTAASTLENYKEVSVLIDDHSISIEENKEFIGQKEQASALADSENLDHFSDTEAHNIPHDLLITIQDERDQVPQILSIEVPIRNILNRENRNASSIAINENRTIDQNYLGRPYHYQFTRCIPRIIHMNRVFSLIFGITGMGCLVCDCFINQSQHHLLYYLMVMLNILRHFMIYGMIYIQNVAEPYKRIKYKRLFGVYHLIAIFLTTITGTIWWRSYDSQEVNLSKYYVIMDLFIIYSILFALVIAQILIIAWAVYYVLHKKWLEFKKRYKINKIKSKKFFREFYKYHECVICMADFVHGVDFIAELKCPGRYEGLPDQARFPRKMPQRMAGCENRLSSLQDYCNLMKAFPRTMA